LKPREAATPRGGRSVNPPPDPLRDIRYWSEPDRGGHFPALEQPALFVEEIRAFFRLVRLAIPDRSPAAKLGLA